MPTPRGKLPQLSESQASKTVTLNEAFAILEALTVGGVLSRTLTTPPASPTEGDVYSAIWSNWCLGWESYECSSLQQWNLAVLCS
ncbi:DUF2793 domain-containing protein [Anabaena catenula FACHB-362]|uniref:DUF2793 domain-containing protein n=1 Tax=Anabaena catenula FACHB-362 TaxID=2692877 RepID=A0ABR8JA20_9NOST|nr:DUF2793 domain-containing protein [Anabaena catenula]MBD2694440.1 DUF2793 domain-containing protein [Anabaena catenula FACHB-362]